MAGYSGTPLPKKLGLKPGHRLALLAAPGGMLKTIGPPPDRVETSTKLAGKTPFDVIVLFVTELAELRARFEGTAERLDKAGGFWVAWPKKASGVKTDVTEDRVREIALEVGLVDNKVCAID